MALSRNKELETHMKTHTHAQNIIGSQDHHHMAYATFSFMSIVINNDNCILLIIVLSIRGVYKTL